MAVIGGHDHIVDGTEETTHVPEKFMHPGYGSTKQKAEALVLDSNCNYSLTFNYMRCRFTINLLFCVIILNQFFWYHNFSLI